MSYSLNTTGSWLLVAFVALLVGACGKSEAPNPAQAPASKVESRPIAGVICSFAPSQSEVVRTLTSVAGGAAATASAIAQATGLTAVLHSSGAYIFTGSAGYVAGTFGGAAAVPAIVVLGMTAGSTAVSLELLCAPQNHPDQVAKVEAAATELIRRTSKYMTESRQAISTKAAPLAAELNKEMSKARSDAVEYANRVSVAIAEAQANRGNVSK